MGKRGIYVLSAAILLGGITSCSNRKSAEEEIQVSVNEITKTIEQISLESQSNQDFYQICTDFVYHLM